MAVLPFALRVLAKQSKRQLRRPGPSGPRRSGPWPRERAPRGAGRAARRRGVGAALAQAMGRKVRTSKAGHRR
eukprot:1820901-Alexandrium_andersonii.AAC.1